ncbi:MAG: ribonuclease, partial [Candidatus Paceibacter sp.]|nr:ribonuclease [Candidatus Paceibacter sp.]
MNGFLVRAVKRWWYADPMTNGAAIAYYAIFSAAPIIILLVIIIGGIFGELTVLEKVSRAIQNFAGNNATELFQALISYAYKPSTSIIAAIVSMIAI